jgi:hypothetical protein
MSNTPESTIDAPIMTMNAPAATAQWRALLRVSLATTLAIPSPSIAGCLLRCPRSPVASLSI